MGIIRYYDAKAFDATEEERTLKRLKNVDPNVKKVRMERCYHLEYTEIVEHHMSLGELMCWLIREPLKEEDTLSRLPTLQANDGETELLIEIGPRFNFSTPYSTNCVNIFHNLGYTEVRRMETSTRYLITVKKGAGFAASDAAAFVELLGDRMTHCQYVPANMPKESFDEQLPPQKPEWQIVPLVEEGRPALEQVNLELGLAFSEEDMDYYEELFMETLERNPTTVELFDCAQSNSEHSRHWFFRGRMFLNGVELPKSLMDLIKDTHRTTNENSTIKLCDNSSAIVGFRYDTLKPKDVAGPGIVDVERVESDLIFTAETHNMPTAVAPFSGATTGTGGRLRDVQAVGRGGVPIAGTAGYCVGCLNIPGYDTNFENRFWKYPKTFASPLQTLIEASNGASDYGNKFGEPLICGFAISYGLRNMGYFWESRREEYVKPIMFSGGLGTMPSNMREKETPVRGQLLAKIGGPVYRIGVGGGAASSVEVQGSGDADLDFNAVQRGDPEMENKLNRVVRACIEMGEDNPILAIHDQGAGGNGNVLKELVEPGYSGAIVFSKAFKLGDPTITALELWGAEYQENNAIICTREDREVLEKICARERCPISFVGVVTGHGKVTLIEDDAPNDFEKALLPTALWEYGRPPFDLELYHVMNEVPKRCFQLTETPIHSVKLKLNRQQRYMPLKRVIRDSLTDVLSVLSVGSKRFLTNKVDRCVGGLIAQQQCVGPLQVPLADYALTTVSHFTHNGIATSIGTQPIKGLLSPAAMAHMTAAEALTNMVFVKISDIADIKCSANWMWAAKLEGEGSKLYDACSAVCQVLKELRIGIDGGKDSLSMAAVVDDEVVKSPGTLVLSFYAPCPDVRVRVTPDLKGPANNRKTSLLWITIEKCARLGGSAFAQSQMQQGDSPPDLVDTTTLSKAFKLTQALLEEGLILAGHDVSDGGLVVCLLEMAFAGLSGIIVDLNEASMSLKIEENPKLPMEFNLMYAEECGWVIEVEKVELDAVRERFNEQGVPNFVVGTTKGYGMNKAQVNIHCGPMELIEEPLYKLYKQWERTSFEIEKLQTENLVAQEEFDSVNYRKGPQYRGPENLEAELKLIRCEQPIRVAVIREEGINSEREMMACLVRANFEVHDVTMSDLLAGTTTLSKYRGVVFPGGFSYADTLGSAKGWAANILHAPLLRHQFENFKNRPETFSLGICNGCQLMTQIRYVGCTVSVNPQVALLKNRSERFECRWSTVRIPPNRSIMLSGMKDFVLGCWVAHGEGRFAFQRQQFMDELYEKQLVALEYVDDYGEPTELYPMNPNGSPKGIAGLCSYDGRHLALMPHPERSSLMYQWPYVPPKFNVSPSQMESPWQLMFNNAYKWCDPGEEDEI